MKKLTLLKIAVIALILLMAVAIHTTFAQVPYDKKLHAGAGVVVGTWGTFAGNSMNWKPEKAALFGIGSVAAAGLGKELWDEIEYGGFDYKDLRATMYGGVVGVGLSYVGLKIFYKYRPKIFATAVQDNMTVGLKIRF